MSAATKELTTKEDMKDNKEQKIQMDQTNQKDEKTKNDVKVVPDNEIIDKIWMVRPCHIYYNEFKVCNSVKGRFNQRYVYGETKDCGKWKEDYKNCEKFDKTKNYQHLVPILENEEERRKIRLAGAMGNDVWEYRTEPPADWNKPVPGLTQEQESSNSELKEDKSRCTIS